MKYHQLSWWIFIIKNKYNMNRIIKTIFLLFALLFFHKTFADQKINYWNYLLTGISNLTSDKTTSVDYFIIFDNKIYIVYFDKAKNDNSVKKFPNGTYRLTTKNNSQILVKVYNGEVKNFELLSNKDHFKQNESEISDDYCKIALFYSNYDKLYNNKKLKHEYYSIVNFQNNDLIIDVINYMDRYIASIYGSNINKNFNNEKFLFIIDNKKVLNDKKELKQTFENNKLNPDIIINNCTVEFVYKRNFIKSSKKLDFQYEFDNLNSLKEKFPFLINTKVAKEFSDNLNYYNKIKKTHKIIISEFEYKNNLYYLLVGYGSYFCGSSGCLFELFSKKDNKTIFTDNDYFSLPVIHNGILYFYDLNYDIIYERRFDY